MKKIFTVFLMIISSYLLYAQDYVGVENCQMCHSGTKGTYPGFSAWQGTLHSKIHMLPSASTMKGNYSDTVKMGSSYGNASVVFRIDGTDYYVKLLPASGSPEEHKIIYTYGGGWKQRYLVKIGNSYYMPPVQWNLKGYLDNSTGSWVAYNPQNWFTSAGALKAKDNSFRLQSWDKKCAGCHVVPGAKTGTVTAEVNGSDTAWVYKWANSNSHQNIVVGCESCHGYRSSMAGPGHVNNLKNLSYDRKLEVCGQCHFRGTSKSGVFEYPYNEGTNTTYKSGEPLSDYSVVKAGYWPDGKTSRQHHQQYLDFKLSDHYNSSMGMTCITCHDPHQNTAQKHQLKEDFNALSGSVGCIKCHPTKANQTNGRNDHSKHLQVMSQCANCHMTHNAVTANSYDITNHSFMPIRPNATRTYSSVTNGMINTCAIACHRNGSGTRGGGPTFGITDASLTNWAEATDIALADSLWKYYQTMYNISSVETANTAIPNEFRLLQNFPNPFNPTTAIQFSVAKKSVIKLEIFTISGEIVNVLLNQEMNPGNYKLEWDSRSVYGYKVPSGVYIYRLLADNNLIASRKMVLMK